ncbi:MAG: methyltransferase domain-containing protein [Bacteroidota bacterium]
MPRSQASNGKSSKKPVSYIFSLLNPLRIIRAINFHHKQKKYCKVSHDMELKLYSEVLSNDMLHYGYFEDPEVKPEDLSFRNVEDAQIRYAERLISHIRDKSLPVLDIGCGIGGIANLMTKHGCTVEVLSPNISQIEYVKKTYPALTSFNVRFEEFSSQHKYGTLLNAESFQYIDMETSFEKAEELMLPGGRWIICDYFSILPLTEKNNQNRLEDFEKKAAQNGWTIIHKEDITLNVMPTLKFVNMYVTRIVNPLLFYLEKKLQVKFGWLHHLTHEIRDKLLKKLTKEFSKLDAAAFVSEKKYMILVLTR